MSQKRRVDASMLIAEALSQAQAAGLDRLDAQLLLLHALGKPLSQRAWLLAHDNDSLAAPVQTRFESLVQRRAMGEPAAYLTGSKEFYGLDLLVDKRVLVPRPDTETLVGWALEVLKPQGLVIDLGTGSGAVALAIKHRRPDAVVSATDSSADALAVAMANAQRLELEVQFSQSSWLASESRQFDLIVSNPPYIASADAHLAHLTHEPLQALASGVDGLDDIRQIIAQAATRLKSGGWLLLEHGYDQAAVVRDLLQHAGFQNVSSKRDLADIERCGGGQQFVLK